MHHESVVTELDFEGGRCTLSYNKIDIESVINSVASSSCGATAIFIGTTRDNFKGRPVVKLEYQAFSRLAIVTLRDITLSALKKHYNSSGSSHLTCVIQHRLGIVPVGEASIAIVAAAPHRKEAFLICEDILEEVKRKAQIWKLEYYENAHETDAEWKSSF